MEILVVLLAVAATVVAVKVIDSPLPVFAIWFGVLWYGEKLVGM